MKPWLGWIRWIDPIYYAFEAVMASEFTGVDYQCSMDMTVPAGPTYQGGNAGCTMAGSTPGSTEVVGTTYLSQGLDFSYSHVWRNLGIISQ
jgi:ABC-type multidrug transport system permease subunit